MTAELKETTQLLAGITHAEMLNVMHHKQILCSVECFRSVLQWAQQRALETYAMADHAKRSLALDAMAENERELGLDYMEAAK